MIAFVTVALAILNAGSALAAPSKRATVDDVTVLQYALTLEHLENNFYSGALAKFDAAAFESAGFESWVRGRFEQIAAHEASHVAFLSGALGSAATKPCTYKFPYTDPKSFAALSQAIEGTGTSAYLGAAQFIQNKAYLTAAASILTVESRHDAWVAAAVDKEAAWNQPYDTPLSFSGVYSIAAQFITGCPSTNPTLPVTTYPAFSLSAPTVGQKSTVTFAGKSTGQTYVAFYSALNVFYAPITNGEATIPTNLTNAGTVYASIVSNNTGTPTDATTLSGLAILDFAFTSSQSQPL